MKIKVTAKHIQNGKPEDCFKCPISLALKEQFSECAVFSPHARVETGGRFFLPPEAQDFVEKFDNRQEVQPFEFEFDEEQQNKINFRRKQNGN